MDPEHYIRPRRDLSRSSLGMQFFPLKCYGYGVIRLIDIDESSEYRFINVFLASCHY